VPVYHPERQRGWNSQVGIALKEQIPNCVIRILHGAGHACQMEQPWLFDRYMTEFLKDHGLSGALRQG
jgi:pimeloyl-ACP methyl ester carboxylesterase